MQPNSIATKQMLVHLVVSVYNLDVHLESRYTMFTTSNLKEGLTGKQIKQFKQNQPLSLLLHLYGGNPTRGGM